MALELRARLSRRAIHITRCTPIIFAVASASACDPCAGMSPCGPDFNRVSVNGRVVTTESGTAVPETAIDLVVVRSGGTDSMRVSTDAEGLFQVTLPSSVVDVRRLRLRVNPPASPPYVIDSLPCAAVWRGEPCVVPTLVHQPHLPMYQFIYRNDPTLAAEFVRVRFTRTGGSNLVGPSIKDTFDVQTGIFGIVTLFPDGVFSSGLQPVVGDLIVDLPPPIGTTLRRSYQVKPTPYFGPRPLAAQAVGPWLAYEMTFHDSATGNGRAGVELSFQRTGGISGSRESFVTMSTQDGLVGFPMLPLTTGTMIGDFTIRVQGAPSVVLPGVSLPTFDADSTIVIKRWQIGATGKLYEVPPP
jgi:hypothetical protein